MRYIIYGAGETGKHALHFLGFWRVYCFAVSYKTYDEFEGKKIISYEEMIELQKKDFCIVVASTRYYLEMTDRLDADGVKKYFVFKGTDPIKLPEVYPLFILYGKPERISYAEVLSSYNMSKYSSIAIYGCNVFLPYLISEIAIQNSFHNITGIIKTSKDKESCTLGLPVVELEQILNQIDCLVINKKRFENEIFEMLDTRAFDFDIVDIYDVDKFIPAFNHGNLEKYKDIHKGNRCFILGNGPSLKIEDLNILARNREICFAVNNMYKIYQSTEWRADYYLICDPRFVLYMMENFPHMKGLFIADTCGVDCMYKDFELIHVVLEEYFPNRARFSFDISSGVYEGSSVIYVAMQIAVYMGFEEIYLLGVDHVGDKHFIEGYHNVNEVDFINKLNDSKNLGWKDTSCYEAAEFWSYKMGFRIYNATPGGNLNNFERVDFNSLF